MGKVIAGFSMSLDGFVAGPHDEIDQVFKWFLAGDATEAVESGGEVFKMTKEGADQIREGGRLMGALVTARRTFDISGAWGGKHPLDVPVVVVTHSVPQEWAKEGSIFTFVTDGVESAIEKAKQIAGEKDVAVGAPSVVQQCLKAGLLDQIHIDLVPVLLFQGVRLFDHLDIAPVELEPIAVDGNPRVFHMDFRVVK